VAAGTRKDDAVKREMITQLHAQFEEILRRDEDSGVEYWLARDLQQVLGYKNWENFSRVIQKAVTACEQAGSLPQDHFLDIKKMVNIGSGAQREVEDIMLTRYACYLIAQNGDPSKPPIAFAQTYLIDHRERKVCT
jgi:DNA-damage-inducible protein D